MRFVSKKVRSKSYSIGAKETITITEISSVPYPSFLLFHSLLVILALCTINDEMMDSIFNPLSNEKISWVMKSLHSHFARHLSRAYSHITNLLQIVQIAISFCICNKTFCVLYRLFFIIYHLSRA